MTRDWKIGLIACCALFAAAVPAPATAQERIGRLFFTPAQRLSLDVARNQRARAALSTEKTEQEAAPVAQTITYGGMVRRNDGKSTVWLNNQPVHDREPVGGATIIGRVRPDGSVTLQVPQSGRSVTLKPGQSVELLSGAIEESYTRRPPAEPQPKPGAKPAADARTGKPLSPEAAKASEREREERQQQVIEDAVSRALQGTAGAKPETAPAQTPKGPAP